PWRASFSDWIRNNLKQKKTVELFQDDFISPIALMHFAQLLGVLIKKQANGIFNVAGSDRLSKYDFGIRLAKKYDYSLDLINGISVDSKTLKAIRPKDMSLSFNKLSHFLGYPPPGIDSGLASL
ncbi:MAG: sugar nucleotide-binding protein, partial [Deltaproteobacteria bacterium]|nr:sugar nucleotide-binding protein [Deltaproteobacteria bacterium]